ncbi:dynein heavy chain 10, axonemal [Arapaima gigas]
MHGAKGDMARDDLRVEWIRNRVCCAFHLTDPAPFEELLRRGGGDGEREILQFLTELSDEESPSALFFFKSVREEEVEVEVHGGTF